MALKIKDIKVMSILYMKVLDRIREQFPEGIHSIAKNHKDTFTGALVIYCAMISPVLPVPTVRIIEDKIVFNWKGGSNVGNKSVVLTFIDENTFYIRSHNKRNIKLSTAPGDGAAFKILEETMQELYPKYKSLDLQDFIKIQYRLMETYQQFFEKEGTIVH